MVIAIADRAVGAAFTISAGAALADVGLAFCTAAAAFGIFCALDTCTKIREAGGTQQIGESAITIGFAKDAFLAAAFAKIAINGLALGRGTARFLTVRKGHIARGQIAFGARGIACAFGIAFTCADLINRIAGGAVDIGCTVGVALASANIVARNTNLPPVIFSRAMRVCSATAFPRGDIAFFAAQGCGAVRVAAALNALVR